MVVKRSEIIRFTDRDGHDLEPEDEASTVIPEPVDISPFDEDVAMSDAPGDFQDVPAQPEQDVEDDVQPNERNPQAKWQPRDIYEDDERDEWRYRTLRPNEHPRANLNQYRNLISYRFKDKRMEAHRFNMIILDESQRLKNADSDLRRSMTLFKCDSIVHVTSTPLFSALPDLLSSLKLMWNLLGIKCTFPNSIGDPIGLYDPAYDPENGLTRAGGEDGARVETKGLFPLLMEGCLDDTHACQVFRAAWEEHKVRLWQLSPRLLKDTGSKFNWNVEFGRRAVWPLLKTIAVRWSRSSKLKLPDGTFDYPGVGIPPTITITEELCHGYAEHHRVRDKCYELADEVPRPNYDDSPRDALELMPSQGYINFGKHREAVFYSFDARFMTLFSNKLSVRCRDRDVFRSTVIKAVIGAQSKDQRTQDNAMEEFRIKLPAVAGIDTVKDLVKHDLIGGLLFWFENTKESGNMVCPATRHEMVLWFLKTNPIMTRLLQHLVDLVLEGKHRVVVYTRFPMIQQ